MKIVTIHEASTSLLRLIEQARKGQEIIISRGSKPIARLVPIYSRKDRRQPGSLKGMFHVDSEFFEPLPEAELPWRAPRRGRTPDHQSIFQISRRSRPCSCDLHHRPFMLDNSKLARRAARHQDGRVLPGLCYL